MFPTSQKFSYESYCRFTALIHSMIPTSRSKDGKSDRDAKVGWSPLNGVWRIVLDQMESYHFLWKKKSTISEFLKNIWIRCVILWLDHFLIFHFFSFDFRFSQILQKQLNFLPTLHIDNSIHNLLQILFPGICTKLA